MGSFDLNVAANIIILISAVIIAIKNIYNFVKKPVDDLKASAYKEEEKHIEEILKRGMPELLVENYNVIMGSLDELKNMTIGQEARLDEI